MTTESLLLLLAALLFLLHCDYLLEKTTQFEHLVFTGVPSFYKSVIRLHWFACGWTVFIELQLSPNENHTF